MNTQIAKNNKPLVIILLSSIHDYYWQKISALLNHSKINNIDFFDFTKNKNDKFPDLVFNQSVLVRLSFTSMGIFEYLLSSSTIPPVIEGANAGNILKNADPPSFGLLCSIYTMGHIFTPKLPAEYYLYPDDLKKAIDFTCVSSYQFEKKPWEFISPLMDKYSDPNRPRLLAEDDRVSKAIFMVEQAPNCQDLSPYQRITQCTLQAQLDSLSLKDHYHFWLIRQVKDFFMGVWNRLLKNICKESTNYL